MARITELRPARRPRGWRVVVLDGEPFCRLPAAAAREAGLAVGYELEPSELRSLRDRATREEAVERALRYLSHRPRSRVELERHLRLRGYEDPAVGEAVARVEALGHLDDRAFAAAFARDRIRLRPRAPTRIESELRKRGVSRADARAGVADALADEGADEAELLRRAAGRGWRRLRTRDPETARRRLLAYLGRRGFRASEARAVVVELVGRGDPD